MIGIRRRANENRKEVLDMRYKVAYNISVSREGLWAHLILRLYFFAVIHPKEANKFIWKVDIMKK